MNKKVRIVLQENRARQARRVRRAQRLLGSCAVYKNQCPMQAERKQRTHPETRSDRTKSNARPQGTKHRTQWQQRSQTQTKPCRHHALAVCKWLQHKSCFVNALWKPGITPTEKKRNIAEAMLSRKAPHRSSWCPSKQLCALAALAVGCKWVPS